MAAFISTKPTTKQKWSLASVPLTDAYTDFILSRQAARCTPATLAFYNYTACNFLEYLTDSNRPPCRGSSVARARLFGRPGWHIMDGELLCMSYSHPAEGFGAREGDCQPVTFDMPALEKKRQPVLTAEQVKRVSIVCNVR